LKYTVKPYEVARRRKRAAREAAPTPSAPKPMPVFNVEAGSDTEARRLVRKRYEQQGRTIRSLNATGDDSLIVYVETK
jgi:hypothetical protein